MNLKIFNSTEEEIEKKKYNIFIGISMGVKPLDKKIAREYIAWALSNTKEKVVILIADDVAKFNYRVFSSYSENKSLKRARREGDEYHKLFKEVLSEMGQKNKVVLLHWKEIFSDKLNSLTKTLKNEFDKNADFQEEILKFVKHYSKRRKRDLSDEKLKYLANYMLFELPTILNGIEYEGTKYNLLFYPTFKESAMGKFVSEIRNSRIFPKLREKLKLEKSMAIVECFIDGPSK